MWSGEVISGFEVAEEVNRLSRGKPNNELLHSPLPVITAVGQIRKGKPIDPEVLKNGLIGRG